MSKLKGNPWQGANFFLQGLKRLKEPGLRRYVLVPLLINAVLMGSATWWGIGLVNGWLESLANWLPSWLAWLYWLLMPVAVLTLVVVLAYSFSTILMVLMAPFSGLLSEQVDKGYGNSIPPETIPTMIKRTLWREMVKLGYLLPRYLGLLILSFIPVVNVVAPALWLIFAAWVVALQYLDYPFDNRQLSFKQAKVSIGEDWLTALGFGGAVLLLLTIPVLNWLVIPAAVIGATMMSHERQLLAGNS